MKHSFKVLLVGIGGYGWHYVNEILTHSDRQRFIISGVVDPMPQTARHYAVLLDMGVPFFATIEDFYTAHTADIAFIASPIQYHCPQACTAMENGSHVMCEKPLSGSVEDARTIIACMKKTKKLMGIGYQWSYSSAVTALKKDILTGRLGKPIRLKTLVSWPRATSYFRRNSWAGKLMDNQGQWIRDSIANNACAHFLHNMLYLLGESAHTATMPQKVQAELYRVNAIETFDTAAVRVLTAGNTEILFLATHAASEWIEPKIVLEFEEATVTYDGNTDKIFKVVFKDGTTIAYGDPDAHPMQKVWTLAEAVQESGILPCGPKAALAQTLCIEAIHASMSPVTLPEAITRLNEQSGQLFAEGLTEVLTACFENVCLPSEKSVNWAQAGKIILVPPMSEA